MLMSYPHQKLETDADWSRKTLPDSAGARQPRFSLILGLECYHKWEKVRNDNRLARYSGVGTILELGVIISTAKVEKMATIRNA